MATLVIKSFPEDLHVLLRQAAAENRRSVTQETIRLLEKALGSGRGSRLAEGGGASYWATRKLLPQLEEALGEGAFSAGTESTEAIGEERDGR